MKNKPNGVICSILWAVAMISLLAAVFDVFPVADNTLIFLALVCFIICGLIKKTAKGGSCCGK